MSFTDINSDYLHLEILMPIPFTASDYVSYLSWKQKLNTFFFNHGRRESRIPPSLLHRPCLS